MIRLAIVGCGLMANAHARGFKKIPGVRITACCDIVEEKAKEFAKKHGIPAYYSHIKKLLAAEELDAIANVTSDDAHAEVSIAALKAGVHVLCEKPLATSLAEAKRMTQVARASKKINMVNFSYRNAAALHLARDIVQSGKIGRITHVEASYLQSWLCSNVWGHWKDNWAFVWRCSTEAKSMGTLGDIGVHILDFTTYVAGPIKTLSCQMSRHKKGVPGEKWQGLKMDANDNVAIAAQFESGAVGCVHATRWASGHANSLRLRVFGDIGAVEVDLDRDELSVRACLGRKAIDKCEWKEIKCRKIPNNFARFIRSIKTGKNEQADFARATEIQAYLDACFQSDKAKKLVKVSAV
jgi:predicted dehydrogenase